MAAYVAVAVKNIIALQGYILYTVYIYTHSPTPALNNASQTLNLTTLDFVVVSS